MVILFIYLNRATKPNEKRNVEEGAVKYEFVTRSEIDILEDGYKWCKYGNKFVKKNPNPRCLCYKRSSSINPASYIYLLSMPSLK